MSNVPKGWWYRATQEEHFECGTDFAVKHSGTRCGYLKSIVENPKPFGNLMSYCVPGEYAGGRLRMKGWVKTALLEGRAQLWLRIDGAWRKNGLGSKAGCFDNMDDRPITGATDWNQYELVVDVPEDSTGIAYGLMLLGKGQIWLDDVSFEKVSNDVPLTGKYSTDRKQSGPVNLDFEED